MQWVETTGRTIEDAKEAALDQLGIDESEAEFEVVEEPKTGLFGRPRGEARIRARVVPKAPRPKQERRPRRQKSGKERSNESASSSTTEASPDAPADAAPSKPREQRSPRKRSGSNGGGRPAKNQQEGNQMTDEEVPVGEQADIITEFLEGLVGALGAEGTVKRTEVDDETIELSVEGADLGLLIGPKGQTLTAVHELSRTVLQRRATGRHIGRVRIDIGGYRQRRQEALARFVQQQAEIVVERGFGPGARADELGRPQGRARHGQRDRWRGHHLRRCRPRSPRGDRPGRHRRMTGALTDLLLEARQRGFLGPGPVEDHLDHARAFAVVAGAAPERAVDLGAGGGLPGLVLATEFWPEARVAVPRRPAEAHRVPARRGRGTRISTTASPCSPSGRSSTGRSPIHRGAYDLVVARSFASPAITIECAAPLLRPGGAYVGSEPPEGSASRWSDEALAELGCGAARGRRGRR